MDNNASSRHIHSQNIEHKIAQLREDYNTEWWRPNAIDDYNLTNKVYSFLISFFVSVVVQSDVSF